MSVGGTNITSDFRERQYNAAHEPPNNSAERAQVDRYLASPTPATLLTLILPAAIKMAEAYQTYSATAAYLAWQAANYSARGAQYRLFIGDALVLNKTAVSKSSDVTGVGSGAPDPFVTPVENIA